AKYHDFMARRLVEMAGHIIMGYLLLDDAQRNEYFAKSLVVYVKYGEAEVARHASFIGNFQPEQIKDYLYENA
ncbi:MAG: acyl-CoA dehydrogenase, partial [Muribaculaceae bacterium]|nr:acyl-CoA dehydrogenase [Muribaculaceae bacterium]